MRTVRLDLGDVASYRFGRVLGLELRGHVSLVALALWSVASGPPEPWIHSPAGGPELLLAAAVALAVHEVGHVLAARALGIRTLEVTFSVVGGSEVHDRPPETRAREVLVAAAGPLANAAVAAACLGGGGPALAALAWTNAALAALDLLPAFSLDGGRLLRAALTLRRDFVAATRLTASVGRAVAAGLALAGLIVSPLLLVPALMAWRAGPREVVAAEERRKLREVAPVRVTVVEAPRDGSAPSS